MTTFDVKFLSELGMSWAIENVLVTFVARFSVIVGKRLSLIRVISVHVT